MTDREPPAALAARSGTHRPGPGHPFQAWAAEQHGAPAEGGYAALHRWSVDELGHASGRPSPSGSTCASPPRTQRVLGDRAMPGAQLVPRRHPQLRRARPARRRRPGPRRRPGAAARRRDATSRARSPGPSCAARSARWPPSCARSAYAPATGSAATCPTSRRPSSPSWPPPPSARVWTSCAPDFGARSVLDRFQQVEPVVLFAVDGYRYGGKDARPHRRPSPNSRRELPTAARRRPHPAARQPEPPTAPWTGRDLTARRRRTGLRAGAVRPPAVGALLLRHHRPAQGASSSATAASCSSTSSSSACTATWAPATASSGTPPPAG